MQDPIDEEETDWQMLEKWIDGPAGTLDWIDEIPEGQWI